MDNAPKDTGRLAPLISFEKRFGGPLRVIAVILSMLVAGLSLYSRFKDDPPVLTTETAFVITETIPEARRILVAAGAQANVRSDAFTQATSVAPGTTVYVAGFYTKNRDDCLLSKFILNLTDESGLTYPLTSVDTTNVRVPLGKQVTILPLNIPASILPGEYSLYIALSYQCGAANQTNAFNRTRLRVKEGAS